ncbi:Haloacid dehalogenase-like hydrolase family protein [Musa troglodytarum]|uniref:Haloacid dehalogenase-like hydrolase family protein n=1 Tax=Musa troglodytarum TaxID=320322 RepID=A0A9E7HL85_9LILI|nr:Haloacid dehalogenase-like hydrolase family protein [Musa troglodytarum]
MDSFRPLFSILLVLPLLHRCSVLATFSSIFLRLGTGTVRPRFLHIKMEYEDRHRRAQRRKLDCLLFDLDDTLYPLSSGIATECLRNIGDYMAEKLGIEQTKIPDFFVHGRLPYENLKPDPVLRHLLQSLPIRKVIFTNGDKVHAAKVLERLGLEDCFQGIICFETLNPPSSSSEQESAADIFDIVDHFSHPRTGVELPETPILCKPSANAMERALRIAHIDPQRTIFFDDSVRNIQSGKRIGLHTVLVGTSQIIKGADHALESIHNIKEAFPELWEEGDKTEDVHHPGKIALETSVIA